MDTLVRRRAGAYLKQELHDLFVPARKRLYGLPALVVPHRSDPQTGQKVYAATLLDEVEAAMYQYMLPGAEQRAVEAFVARVDELQEELDDLRRSVAQAAE